MELARDANAVDMKKRRSEIIKPCKECGKIDAMIYTNPVRTHLILRQLCFSCNFWSEYIVQKDDLRSVRVDGDHFWILPEADGDKVLSGFSGRRYRIRFFDGRIVTTTNLWSQGFIPDRFKERLKDNATRETV